MVAAMRANRNILILSKNSMDSKPLAVAEQAFLSSGD